MSVFARFSGFHLSCRGWASAALLIILQLVGSTAMGQPVQLPRAYLYGQGDQPQAPFYAIMQGNLRILDYYSGAIDGRVGSATAEALRRFQRDRGLPADGQLNAATTRAAKIAVADYYRRQLGFDFNGLWAPEGECRSAAARFQIHQSAWFRPTGSNLNLPRLDFAEVRAGQVAPRLSDQWPALRSDGRRPYIEVAGPPQPLAKPGNTPGVLPLTASEAALAERHWPTIDLTRRARVAKPAETSRRERQAGPTERRYLQRCS